MDELIDFFLHLAFGGFLFLGLIYVLRVVFFLSPHECLSSEETISRTVQAESGPEIVEKDGAAFQDS